MMAKTRMVMVAVASLVTLGGCSSSVLSDLPTWAGGLPADAPERPAETAVFPAVHDMPPERPTPTLSDEEQQRLARELAAARDRNARAGNATPTGQAGTGGQR